MTGVIANPDLDVLLGDAAYLTALAAYLKDHHADTETIAAAEDAATVAWQRLEEAEKEAGL